MASGGNGSYSREVSPGMVDVFADTLDDDYESKIEYDVKFDASITIEKGLDWKDDYEPLKFGLKLEKMMIVLEY